MHSMFILCRFSLAPDQSLHDLDNRYFWKVTDRCYHVIAFLDIDRSYLYSHWSIAVTWYEIFVTPSWKYLSLFIKLVKLVISGLIYSLVKLDLDLEPVYTKDIIVDDVEQDTENFLVDSEVIEHDDTQSCEVDNDNVDVNTDFGNDVNTDFNAEVNTDFVDIVSDEGMTKL